MTATNRQDLTALALEQMEISQGAAFLLPKMLGPVKRPSLSAGDLTSLAVSGAPARCRAAIGTDAARRRDGHH